MKYRTLASFDRDLRRLPAEHQRMFQQALRSHFLPAIDAGAFAGSPPWPTRLRIHKLSNCEVCSLMWNFTSPDGRATFHLEKTNESEPTLVWRRIGDHGIYDRP